MELKLLAQYRSMKDQILEPGKVSLFVCTTVDGSPSKEPIQLLVRLHKDRCLSLTTISFEAFGGALNATQPPRSCIFSGRREGPLGFSCDDRGVECSGGMEDELGDGEEDISKKLGSSWSWTRGLMAGVATSLEALSVSRKGSKQQGALKGSLEESLSYSLSAGDIAERGEKRFQLGKPG